ncbi:MAG: hypothetical protein ACHQJ6_03695 [Candidatus Berkiellales bacterium]
MSKAEGPNKNLQLFFEAVSEGNTEKTSQLITELESSQQLLKSHLGQALRIASQKNREGIVGILINKLKGMLQSAAQQQGAGASTNLFLIRNEFRGFVHGAFQAMPTNPHPNIPKYLLGVSADWLEGVEKETYLLTLATTAPLDYVKYFTQSTQGITYTAVAKLISALSKRANLSDRQDVVIYLHDLEARIFIESMIIDDPTAQNPTAADFYQAVRDRNRLKIESMLGARTTTPPSLVCELAFGLCEGTTPDDLAMMALLLTQCKKKISAVFRRAKLCEYAESGNVEGLKCVLENSVSFIHFNDLTFAKEKANATRQDACVQFLEGKISGQNSLFLATDSTLGTDFITHQLKLCPPQHRGHLAGLMFRKFAAIGALAKINFLIDAEASLKIDVKSTDRQHVALEVTDVETALQLAKNLQFKEITKKLEGYLETIKLVASFRKGASMIAVQMDGDRRFKHESYPVSQGEIFREEEGDLSLRTSISNPQPNPLAALVDRVQAQPLAPQPSAQQPLAPQPSARASGPASAPTSAAALAPVRPSAPAPSSAPASSAALSPALAPKLKSATSAPVLTADEALAPVRALGPAPVSAPASAVTLPSAFATAPVSAPASTVALPSAFATAPAFTPAFAGRGSAARGPASAQAPASAQPQARSQAPTLGPASAQTPASALASAQPRPAPRPGQRPPSGEDSCSIQ